MVILYIDDFKLSINKFVKYIQIFSFLCITIYATYYVYYIYSTFDITYKIKDHNNINLHGHISIDKETGKAISHGTGNIDSNIGLGATVSGVSGAVARGITKSSVSPVQKAGIIMAGGGAIHEIASTINHNSNTYSNTGSSINKISNSDNINSLINLSKCKPSSNFNTMYKYT